LTRPAEFARQAIELAERHGWTDEPAFGVACRTLGATLVWQGRPEEAERWVEHGERTVTAEAEPAAAVAVRYTRGAMELARGRDLDALAAFRAAERLARHLDTPHLAVAPTRAMQLIILVRLGEIDPAEHFLAGLNDQDREHGYIRIAEAALRLAQHDPSAAAAALAPVLNGSASVMPWIWLADAFCSRRAPGTRSANRMPPTGPWSARWTWPNATGLCCGSCCTRFRACWNATPGSAQPTPT
jgi:LuxR family transcriptional regulator, maltose regulon positive regulatory protein